MTTVGRASAQGERTLVLAAVAAAFAASLLLAVAAGTASRSGTAAVTPSGRVLERTTVDRDRGLADSPGDVVFFAVPVVVAAAPLAVRRGRRAVCAAATGLLGLWVLFLAFAGGLFYLPATLLLLAAATAGPPRPA